MKSGRREVYGKELILDLYECDSTKFNRPAIKRFFKELCALMDMKKCDFHFWDYEGYPEEYKKAPDHLKGTSAIQFITTSNITIHTLDKLQKVFLNIFSCKDFNERQVMLFCVDFFKGQVNNFKTVDRL